MSLKKNTTTLLLLLKFVEFDNHAVSKTQKNTKKHKNMKDNCRMTKDTYIHDHVIS